MSGTHIAHVPQLIHSLIPQNFTYGTKIQKINYEEVTEHRDFYMGHLSVGPVATLSNKRKLSKVDEMAQWLRTPACFQRIQHPCGNITAYNSGSRRANALFWPLRVLNADGAYTFKQNTLTGSKNKTNIFRGKKRNENWQIRSLLSASEMNKINDDPVFTILIFKVRLMLNGCPGGQ